MAKVTSESAFEDSIEAHLLASGWLKGDPSGYDRSLGLDPVRAGRVPGGVAA